MLKSVVNGQRVVVSSTSLQSDEVVVKSKNNPQKTHYVVVPAPAKLTRAEQDAARNEAAIADLRREGSIVARGAWQTGTGNYKKARAVPAGAQEFHKAEGRAPANVLAWFAAHPRAQRCVAVLEAVAA